MEYSVKSGNPDKQRSSCVVVGIFDNRRLSNAATQIDRASDGYISSIIRRGDLEGKPGQSLLLHNVPNMLCDRVLLIGCGKERDFDDNAYTKAISVAVDCLSDSGATEASLYLPDLSVKSRNITWKISRAVQQIETKLYRFDQLKSNQETVRRPLKKMTLNVPSRRELSAGEKAIKQGEAIGKGMNLCRDLGNLPGNICTPTYLSEQAQKLSKEYKKLKTSIIDKPQMEKLGMNSLLSVTQGTVVEPKLIVMEYEGSDKKSKPVVLIGKGITFDSGGISLKPGAAMDEMKFDMCGGASVFGTMQAICQLDLKINVVGLVPATENMPDAKATKPGDIFTSMSGQTIEVLNTDAEGRLILCDTMTYAEKYSPDAVIDIATLTGACIIALGNHAHGLMGNHSPLVNELLNAGKNAADRAWELPLWDEYHESLKSNFADMANIGGREAGSITAGCFLSKFAKKFHWAHLDIAGTAWKSGKDKGATGRPVPLLVNYLLERAG